VNRHPRPGVSRADRLSDEGLQRLQRQLASAMRVSEPVLLQWVRRYGEPAVILIEAHGRMSHALRRAIEALQEEGRLP
jgi:hypothetical protein